MKHSCCEVVVAVFNLHVFLSFFNSAHGDALRLILKFGGRLAAPEDGLETEEFVRVR